MQLRRKCKRVVNMKCERMRESTVYRSRFWHMCGDRFGRGCKFGRKFSLSRVSCRATRAFAKPRVARASQVLAALDGGDTLALGAQRFSKRWPRQLRRWPRPPTNAFTAGRYYLTIPRRRRMSYRRRTRSSPT